MSAYKVVLKAFGMEPLSLEVQPQEKPDVPAGHVLVNMKVAPVNPADIFSILGVYPGYQPSAEKIAADKAVPGLEGMGVIAELGAGVTKFNVGQRVVPFLLTKPELLKGGNGSWQSYIVVAEEDIFAVPEGVSDESAAQFVVNPFTALAMIKELNIPQGEWLIQTAAGSVLGRQVITIAKHLGIKTINLVRRAEQAEELKALGADEVLTFGADVPEKVKAITGGKGAYGGLDCVIGEAVAQVTSSIRDNGTVLLYGAMAGLEIKLPMGVVDVLFRGVTIKGFWVTPYCAAAGAAKTHALAEELWGLFKAGVIEPYSGQKFDLADVKAAVAASTTAARGGKVLLSI